MITKDEALKETEKLAEKIKQHLERDNYEVSAVMDIGNNQFEIFVDDHDKDIDFSVLVELS